MVDEYQDNSHTQERMLKLLSNGHKLIHGGVNPSIVSVRQTLRFLMVSSSFSFENPDAGKLILKRIFVVNLRFLMRLMVFSATSWTRKSGHPLYDKTYMLAAGSDKQKEPHPWNETEVLIYNSDEASVTPDEEGVDQPISSGEISLVIKEIIKLRDRVRFEDITLLAPTRNTYLDLMAFWGARNSFGTWRVQVKLPERKIMLDTLVPSIILHDYALAVSPSFTPCLTSTRTTCLGLRPVWQRTILW